MVRRRSALSLFLFLFLLLAAAPPVRGLRNFSTAAAWDANASTLVFVRVQKTASKSLVFLLERRSWLLGGGGGQEGSSSSSSSRSSSRRSSSSNSSMIRPSCQRTQWLGQTSGTCRVGVHRTLIDLQRGMHSRSSSGSGACLINGHCGLDTLLQISRSGNASEHRRERQRQRH